MLPPAPNMVENFFKTFLRIFVGAPEHSIFPLFLSTLPTGEHEAACSRPIELRSCQLLSSLCNEPSFDNAGIPPHAS